MTLLPSLVTAKLRLLLRAEQGASAVMSEAYSKPCHIGLLLFPEMTQIDFTEPYEVFARLPDTVVHVVAKTARSGADRPRAGAASDVTCDDCPELDVIVVPGGPGTSTSSRTKSCSNFCRAQAKQANYVTSVCTGALVLGAAGLLGGYRATTHWLSLPLLELFGAIAVQRAGRYRSQSA